MSKRASQAFRPRLEASEERLLTTVLAGAAPAFHRASVVEQIEARREAHAPASSQRAATLRGDTRAVVAFGLPRGGAGLRGAPSRSVSGSYVNWGVVTIVNTTSSTITYSVSASTYNFGQYQNFTLRPGGRQAYYAQYGGPFGTQPTFNVSFDVVQHFNSIRLSDINVVNESPRWVPRAGTEGRPYAITNTGSGYNLVPMF